MKRRNILVCICILSLAVVLFVSGCQKAKDAEDEDVTDVISTDVSETDEDTDNEDEKEEEQKEETPVYTARNPLTGLPCPDDIASSRPVAIMLNNIRSALPQMGIAKADILYECLTEGAITRLMGVFSDYAELPETGSVRSSRDYFIDLAQAHDAIYAHCGGSTYAYQTFAERKIDHLDGTNDYLPKTFWRSPERLKTYALEHTTMTSGEGLKAGIEQKGFRTELKSDFKHPLKFYDTDTDITGSECTSFTVKFSYYAQSFFDYDETAKEYSKGQFDGPHIDGYTNEAITFKNVIVLASPYTAIADDSYGRLSLDFEGSGYGYYFTNGSYKKIMYYKSDRQSPYTLYESDGKTPLYINPGKSYIGIVGSLSDVLLDD